MIVDVDPRTISFVTNEKTLEGFLTIIITFDNGDVMAYLYNEFKDYIKDLTKLSELGFDLNYGGLNNE